MELIRERLPIFNRLLLLAERESIFSLSTFNTYNSAFNRSAMRHPVLLTSLLLNYTVHKREFFFYSDRFYYRLTNFSSISSATSRSDSSLSAPKLLSVKKFCKLCCIFSSLYIFPSISLFLNTSGVASTS